MSLEEREKKRKSIVSSFLTTSDASDKVNAENKDFSNSDISHVENDDKVDSLVVKIQKREKKTKPTSFLLKPSVHDMAMRKAKQLDVSLNEIVNQLLEAWANQE